MEAGLIFKRQAVFRTIQWSTIGSLRVTRRIAKGKDSWLRYTNKSESPPCEISISKASIEDIIEHKHNNSYLKSIVQNGSELE